MDDHATLILEFEGKSPLAELRRIKFRYSPNSTVVSFGREDGLRHGRAVIALSLCIADYILSSSKKRFSWKGPAFNSPQASLGKQIDQNNRGWLAKVIRWTSAKRQGIDNGVVRLIFPSFDCYNLAGKKRYSEIVIRLDEKRLPRDGVEFLWSDIQSGPLTNKNIRRLRKYLFDTFDIASLSKKGGKPALPMQAPAENFFHGLQKPRNDILVNPSAELRIAVDSTLLLSADSYLRSIRFPDPHARDDFEFVVTVFCGCKHIYLRRPPSKPSGLTPLLSLFWANVNSPQPPAATAGEIEYDALLGNFEALMQERPEDLRMLARHQLLDPRMDTIFWGGGNTEETLKKVYRFLKGTGYLDRNTPLTTRLSRKDFKLCAKSKLLAPDVGGTISFIQVYLFNLFAKGPPYAFQSDGAVYYHSAWARAYALSGRPRQRVQFAKIPPWGSILTELERTLFLRQLVETSEEAFSEKLWRLRDFTLNAQFDPNASSQMILEYLFTGLTVSGLIPDDYLLKYFREKYTPTWRENSNLEAEIVTDSSFTYGRTRRNLGEMASRIANGERPIVPNRDTFRLEWVSPPDSPLRS